MMPVRIYLSCIDKEKKWEHHVFRDIDTMRHAWELKKGLFDLAVIHVGYDRPDYEIEAFPDLSSYIFTAPVFLTEAARWALPAIYSHCYLRDRVTCRFPNRKDSCLLYLASREWGYEIENDFVPPSIDLTETEDWIRLICENDTEIAKNLADNHIRSESKYVSLRASLPRMSTETCDKFRFQHYLPLIDQKDPFVVLGIAPLWLLKLPIQRINPTVRLQTVCSNNKINVVEDFLGFNADSLLALKNFGRKSLKDLAEALINTIHTHKINPEDVSLYWHLQNSLNGIPKNAKHVIYSRLGVNGKPLTLQQIGDCFDVTRERIRQIEKKFIGKIIETEIWDDHIIKKIETLLKNRTEPLFLEMLAAEDNWFSGFEKNFDFLGSVIETFSSESLHVVEFYERKIILKASDADLTALIKEIRATLNESRYSDSTKESIMALVQAKCLGFSMSEMFSLIWDYFSDELHFANNEKNQLVFMGLGKSIDHVVGVVLEEADRPIHYSEIHSRTQERLNRKVAVRRVHNALSVSESAKLFGRGTYGLEKHLKFTEVERLNILSSAEDIILNGPNLKQWHASEILTELESADCELPEEIDAYSMSLVLEESNKLISLGRHVWVSKYRDDLSTNDRIQTSNAFITILKEAGHPLTTQDLVKGISKYRGVKAGLIQIHSNDVMLKVAPNTWGLIHRDVPFPSNEVKIKLDILAAHLATFNKGIHISELEEIFLSYNCPLQKNQDPYIFLSLCKKDLRFRGWQGSIIGLSAWEEPRRHSFSSAFKQVFDAMISPKTIDEITKEVEILLERNVDKSKVSNALSTGGASYNREAGYWLNPAASEENGLPMTESSVVHGG